MMYACSYEDCSYHGIAREIDGDLLAIDDDRRVCGGSVLLGDEQTGFTPRACLRLLDALNTDGSVLDHVEMLLPELPAPPPAPTEAEIAAAAAAPVVLPPPTTGQIVDALGLLDPATATIAEVIAAITGAAQPVAVAPEPVQAAPPTV